MLTTRIPKFVALAVLAAFVVILPYWVPDKLDTSINPFLIAAIGAIGLNLLMGSAGEISLGTAAVMAVGSYTVVLVAKTELELPFVAAVLIAVPIGALISAVVGLTTARLKGLYAVLSTLALHFLVVYVAFRYQNSSNSVAAFSIPLPDLWGWEIEKGARWYVVLVVCTSLVFLGYRQLLKTYVGRAWVAIRDRSQTAETLGIPAAKYRLLAFALSGGIFAFSGALQSYYQGVVSYDSYTLNLAVLFLAMIVVGGRGSPTGSLIGAAVFVVLPTEFRALLREVNPEAASSPLVSQWEQVFDGIVLIVFMSLAPLGIAGAGNKLRGRLATVRARRKLASEEHQEEEADQVQAEQARRSMTATLSATISSVESPLLAVDGLSAGYRGGGLALHDVSLAVGRGEVVAVLGPNGAGKTSLLRAIAGFTRAEGGFVASGTITFDGKDIGSTSSYRRARSGLVMVPERDKVFAELTVSENLDVATRRSDPAALSEVFALFPQLEELGHRPAVLLSGGERQMLAIARALLLQPKVLCLDETTLGLAPRIAGEVMNQLRALAARFSTGVLLVEQNVHLALGVADRFYVLNRGRIEVSGEPTSVSADDLMSAYFGWEQVGG